MALFGTNTTYPRKIQNPIIPVIFTTETKRSLPISRCAVPGGVLFHSLQSARYYVLRFPLDTPLYADVQDAEEVVGPETGAFFSSHRRDRRHGMIEEGPPSDYHSCTKRHSFDTRCALAVLTLR
jgi:hypothetical protein